MPVNSLADYFHTLEVDIGKNHIILRKTLHHHQKIKGEENCKHGTENN